MSDWKADYQQKSTTAEEVAAQVKSGDHVYIGQTSSIAYALAEALMEREGELEDVTILSQNVVRPLRCYIPGHRKTFKISTLYRGPAERMIDDPESFTFYSCDILDQENWVKYIAKPDWCFFEVSVPDSEGWMSYGTGGVTHHETLRQYGKHIVLQVNRNVPYVFGQENKIHVSQADMIVEADTPLNTVDEPQADEAARAISSYILEQVPDGAALQIGIGAVSGAVGLGLMQKNDLGIHSEMFTDSMMRLIRNGNVTNMKKSFLRGKSGVVFCLGTRELYDFCDHNDSLYFAPYNCINRLENIAANDNAVSINSALSVDLLGQVSAESIGFRQYSGTGGQVNFVKGAQMSKGGKSFIAINSSYTDKSGKLRSKICLSFPPGTAVTTPRNEVQFVVTEYGCVNLKTLSRAGRALALIELAHPQFRDELRDQAREVGLIP